MADIVTTYTLTTPGPDITFNSGSLKDGVDKYWLTSIQGLDGPEIRAPVDLVPFGDGGIIHTFRKGPRRPIFDGIFLLDPFDQVNCQDRRNDLAEDLQSALSSIITVAGTLSWTPIGQAAKSLAVYNEVGLVVNYTDDYMVSTFSFGLISAAAEPS